MSSPNAQKEAAKVWKAVAKARNEEAQKRMKVYRAAETAAWKAETKAWKEKCREEIV